MEEKKRYIINGKEYERLEDVPEADRAFIEKGLKELADAEAAAGIPPGSGGPPSVKVSKSSSFKFVIGKKGHEKMVGLAGPEPLDPDRSNGWLIWVAVIGVLLGWLAYHYFLRR